MVFLCLYFINFYSIFRVAQGQGLEATRAQDQDQGGKATQDHFQDQGADLGLGHIKEGGTDHILDHTQGPGQDHHTVGQGHHIAGQGPSHLIVAGDMVVEGLVATMAEGNNHYLGGLCPQIDRIDTYMTHDFHYPVSN